MSSFGDDVATSLRSSIDKKNRRHDSGSDVESEEQGRSERKAMKKAKKEQKKERKEKKQKRSSDKEKGRENDLDFPVKDDIIVKTEEIKAPTGPISHIDFFASLTAVENKKPAVGTVHTVGKKPEAEKKTGSWNCPKCSTSNMNNSHQCHKCKAIKRMTEYR